MTKHDHLMEQYEDALFALLMDGVAEAEGEEALLLNEVLMKDPTAEVPEEINKHCENTIRTAFAQKRMRAARHTAMRCLVKIALVAVISGLLFTAAFALSEDVRVSTLNAIIQVMDDRTQITFNSTSSENTNRPSTSIHGLEYNYNIALEWIPDGFQLETGYSETGIGDLVSYMSPLNGFIEVNITPCNPNLVCNLNTEDCTEQDVIVQEHQATLYITNEDMIKKRYHDNGNTNIWNELMIFWIDQENQVMIQVNATNLTVDEMILLANGVHWQNHI